MTALLTAWTRFTAWLFQAVSADTQTLERQALERYLSTSSSLQELEYRQRRWDRDARVRAQFF